MINPKFIIYGYPDIYHLLMLRRAIIPLSHFFGRGARGEGFMSEGILHVKIGVIHVYIQT